MQLKIGWRGALELAGLFRFRTRTFEAKNCQSVSADAVSCFLNILDENERTNAELSKLDKSGAPNENIVQNHLR